jgi:myo-inositol-1(or 4)-monophosphatase
VSETVVGFRPETRVAIESVVQALEVVRDRAGASEITMKSGLDLVTATDVAAEDTVRAVLGEALGQSVVGEERGGNAAAGESYWLVDPICGTRNFAFGIPLYCVNVALVEDEEITVAVVGDPSSGEVNVAERGGGAWALSGGSRRRLRAADTTQTIVIEDSHADADENRRARAAESVARAIRTSRWDLRALSTSLALAYVAAGRVAAYVLFSSSALHVGAGSLLASEAGATVSDLDGRPWTIHSDSIVASATAVLHASLLEITRYP